jgi:serine/threonine protein kinase
MAIQSGTHVGPYEILSAIGAGGMGKVYRAGDPNSNPYELTTGKTMFPWLVRPFSIYRIRGGQDA